MEAQHTMAAADIIAGDKQEASRCQLVIDYHMALSKHIWCIL